MMGQHPRAIARDEQTDHALRVLREAFLNGRDAA